MRNATFQMYDDSLSMSSISPIRSSSSNSSHRPVRFPTHNIVTPIVLLWGDHDSLVDISVLLNALPDHTVEKRLKGYEHVDILWGKDTVGIQIWLFGRQRPMGGVQMVVQRTNFKVTYLNCYYIDLL
jgi:hypothetical protein